MSPEGQRVDAGEANAPPFSPDQTPGTEPVTLNIRELLQLYQNKNHELLQRRLLEGLYSWGRETFIEIGPEVQQAIDEFTGVLFYFLTQPDYFLSRDYAHLFILHQPLLSNLAGLSCFAGLNVPLQMLQYQPNNFIKTLALNSPRNSFQLDARTLFDTDPAYASLWYSIGYYTCESFSHPTVYTNMVERQRSFDSRFVIPGANYTHPYFQSTYVDMASARTLRSELNRRIRQSLENVVIRNRPVKNRIAILTGAWSPVHSTYRSLYPYLKSLHGDYDLVLFHLGEKREDLDLELFSEVHPIAFHGETLNLEAVQENDFQVVLYPDLGLDPESRYLANLRLAPIQVACYGNPVSSSGSLVDYYIGGAAVELPQLAQENYSERLVLMPGIGAHPTYPAYQRRHCQRSDHPLLINCCWSAQKINYPILLSLQQMQERFSRPCRFRFFPGSVALRFNAFALIKRDLEEVLGADAVEVIPHCGYQDYMHLMEEASLSLDSYPFGGYNTIMDSLYLGIPVVSWEGTSAPNRIASQLLRLFGLDELVASGERAYVEKAVRLVNDEPFRLEAMTRIEAIDLRSFQADKKQYGYFRKALDYLIEHHDRLRQDPSCQPIVIPT